MDTAQSELIEKWLQYFRNRDLGITSVPPSEDVTVWEAWYLKLPKTPAISTAMPTSTIPMVAQDYTPIQPSMTKAAIYKRRERAKKRSLKSQGLYEPEVQTVKPRKHRSDSYGLYNFGNLDF